MQTQHKRFRTESRPGDCQRTHNKKWGWTSPFIAYPPSPPALLSQSSHEKRSLRVPVESDRVRIHSAICRRQVMPSAAPPAHLRLCHPSSAARRSCPANLPTTTRVRTPLKTFLREKGGRGRWVEPPPAFLLPLGAPQTPPGPVGPFDRGLRLFERPVDAQPPPNPSEVLARSAAWGQRA